MSSFSRISSAAQLRYSETNVRTSFDFSSSAPKPRRHSEYRKTLFYKVFSSLATMHYQLGIVRVFGDVTKMARAREENGTSTIFTTEWRQASRVFQEAMEQMTVSINVAPRLAL